MINVDNWQQRKERYEQYWNRTNKTPLLFVTAPKEGAVCNEALNQVDSDTAWFDPHWMARSIRDYSQATYFGGEAYPLVSPSLGPDILSAFLGLEVNYNATSAWVTHKECPLSDITDFTFDKDNWHYKKIKEILSVLTEDAKNGDYIVGMVDLNPGADGVASLIGPDKLCYEMMDSPEDVQRVSGELFDLYTKVFDEFHGIITKYQKGTTNWLGIYSETPWYFLSCDFMCMISGEFFDEFLAWELGKRIDYHPRTLFHLDGENAVRHLDRILQFDKLTGVQVQATPYVHSAEFWVEPIKKIQAAGKCVCIDARNEEDIRVLLENCKPEGLYIRTWFETEAKAKEIEKMVQDFYRT